MARHGLDDIQVANQVIGATKIGRLLDLAEYLGPTGRISCAVDSLAGAAALSAACVRRGVRLGVLVEVDSGLHRCGLASVGDVAALSRAVMGLDGLDLLGLLTHAGHAYGAKTPEDVRRIGTHEGALLAGMAETLRRGGIPIGTVSVGSTPTARHAGEVAGVTELRPGNYIFNDMTQVALGVASMDQCGLTVLATVISTPAPGRAVLDAGAKALALDKGAQGSTLLQGHGTILGKRATLARLSEEHGVIEHQGEQFVIGEKVRIVPNHACPVVNLFDYAWLVEGEKIVGRVGIAARGKMR
jgi:D-serine deaminase-like pyridoxal phosphate-dependent protein